MTEMPVDKALENVDYRGERFTTLEERSLAAEVRRLRGLLATGAGCEEGYRQHYADLLDKSSAEVRLLREEIDRLQEELETYRALDTCMCGSPMEGHTWGDGHAPVSMYDYHLGCLEEENRNLKARIEQLIELNKVGNNHDSELAKTAYESIYEEVKRLQAEKDELQGELKLLRAACMEWKQTAIDCEVEWKLWQDVAERYQEALERVVSDGDYTNPEGMKQIAHKALRGGEGYL